MRVLVTGGAGFIGCNLTHHLISKGNDVIVYDNLSRPRTQFNLEWLKNEFGKGFSFVRGDIRDMDKLAKAAKKVDAIYHMAGQVAITTSVANPREDFEINAYGTFNVLEAARKSGRQPIVFYASTNKVYGGLERIKIFKGKTRYFFKGLPKGVPESFGLDFYSPYGCSKGCGDQYVRDYSRIYNLPTIVFRQSCIYGYRQFGVEDQGWLAHFVIAAISGKDIIIYGDGKQVRDVLFIDDLINAINLAVSNIKVTSGNVYNIGGGYKNTLSVWTETKLLLEGLLKKKIKAKMFDWRPGDQRIYVSDMSKAKKDFGFYPKISPKEGIGELFLWVEQNKVFFK